MQYTPDGRFRCKLGRGRYQWVAYYQHVAAFDARHRMLTCPGVELTGQPLPLNHQNAFPLKHHV